MHKNVIGKVLKASLFLTMGVALSFPISAQTAARAESGHDSYTSGGSDDDHRRQDRGYYDYHDGRRAHEGHEYVHRDHLYSYEESEQARRDRAHHEHEGHEGRGH